MFFTGLFLVDLLAGEKVNDMWFVLFVLCGVFFLISLYLSINVSRRGTN